MAESRVKKESYIVIQGWMLTDLELKGNELLIYACIYGFSQAESQTFSGSLQYLADWTNSTKQSVIKCLKSLVDKGYLEKNENTINGVKFCEYRTTDFNTLLNKVYHPIKESLTGGMQQSLTNNIAFDNTDNKKDNKAIKGSFDAIIAEYAKGDSELTDLLCEWLKVRKAKRAAMTDRAIQMNLSRLDELAAKSRMSVTDYLKEVICRGWAAFYEIHNYNTGKRVEPVPKWASKEQRDYDFTEIEKATVANSPELQQRAEELKRRIAAL